MKKNNILKQITFFIILLALFLVVNNVVKNYLLSNNITSYNIHLGYKTVSKLLLALVSFLVAKKLNLFDLGGLTKVKPKKLGLLIFPVVLFVVINGISLDLIPNFTILNVFVLLIYCIIIGVSEELSLRSVLLPLISKYFGNDKKAQIKAVFISALLFGILHLIKFDKGLYGEIAQVFYATFIGLTFGALLLVIKRVYPLIIIHAIIDFVAKIDSVGQPIKNVISNPTSLENALLSILLSLPCLIYGVYVIKKYVK